MKFLKYLIFFLLAIALFFVLLGFLKPTVKYGHEILVDKSVEEAWAVHQDESKYNQWLKGFQSIDLVSGEKGKVGSKYKVKVKPSPTEPEFVMIETISSIKENDHISLSFDSDMSVFEQKTSFTKEGNKTKVKTESEVLGKGLMMKSLFAAMEMFAGAFEKQEVENIENLKKVINENTTNYFPVTEPETSMEIQE